MTLIEYLLAIAALLVFVAVGIGIRSLTVGSGQDYSAATGLVNLHAGIKSIYPNGDYTDLGTNGASIIINSGKVPQGLVVGRNLVGQFGGTIGLLATNYGSGTNNAFAIVYPNVPRIQCNEIISACEGEFVSVEVGTSNGPSNFAAGASGIVKDLSADNPVRPNEALVSTACKNESNTIRFTSI